MTPLLTTLAIVWAVPTFALVILLIYQSTLSIHEDDQLFLDEAESHMQQEQAELIAKLNKIQPYVRALSAISGGLIVLIFGIWIYHGISQL
jgi:Tfp pilus assembly protein PilN